VSTNGPQPPPPGPPPLSLRLLGLCPLFIAILWVAGIANFRKLELKPVEWAVVVAAGFAIHVLTRRLSRPKPLPPLPPEARPVPLAALAGLIVAFFATVLGGVAEAIVQSHYPSELPWGLRTMWHTACAFGASYCAFLQRLLRVMRD